MFTTANPLWCREGGGREAGGPGRLAPWPVAPAATRLMASAADAFDSRAGPPAARFSTWGKSFTHYFSAFGVLLCNSYPHFVFAMVERPHVKKAGN